MTRKYGATDQQLGLDLARVNAAVDAGERGGDALELLTAARVSSSSLEGLSDGDLLVIYDIAAQELERRGWQLAPRSEGRP